MEPLIDLPFDQWNNLRDLYRNEYPEGAVAYCLLDHMIAYPGIRESYDFKVYTICGDIANGMVAISPKEEYQLFIHPIGEDIKKTEEALLKTKLIDWNRDPTVASASSQVQECLKGIIGRLGMKIDFYVPSRKHFKSRESGIFSDLVCPPNTYIGPCKPNHINLIDTTWTFYNQHSHLLFELLMKHNLTHVLYSSEDHSPLAWINIDESGAFSHLYVLEAHRRKGYAEFLVRFASNLLISEGKDVLTYTLLKNEKSLKLFRKLGFEETGLDSWVYLKNLK